MNSNPLRSTFALLVLALACGVLPAQHAAAQARWDDPVVIKRKPTVRQPAVQPVRNTRRPVRTARRAPVRTAPSTERAALLTLQWRIVRFREDGSQEEVSPGMKFGFNDKLRIAVKVNQDGYLYIVRQQDQNSDGQLVFPDKRHNNGSNFVKKNAEFILPSDCNNFDVPCWYAMQPPAGQEFFTLVFSRDPKDSLPSSADEGVVTVAPALLKEIRDVSGQQIRRSQGVLNSRYTIWIRNVNQEDNEEIIETLVLNKGGDAAPAAAGAAPESGAATPAPKF